MSSKPQGKKGKAAAADRGAGRERLALVGFGVLLIVLFVVVAAAQGLGNPEPSGDEVAVIEDAPDGTITQEELDFWIAAGAYSQGIEEVPAEDDPQYAELRDSGLSQAILARWVVGEAEERGIEVTETEVDEALQQEIETSFGGSQKRFDKFLEQSPYDEERARDTIRLSLLSEDIQTAVVPEDPEVTDEEIQAYYDANSEQFEQPATRDVRVVLTKTEGEADEAVAELGDDPSAKDWDEVATKYSIDEATKTSGGLREGVVEGQSEPALDEEIFGAPEGELVGPFETDAGFYVIQVEQVTEATTTPLEDASEQIRQTLVSARQQEIVTDFQEDFQAKWTARTFCADGYRIDQCANAEAAPSACTEEAAESTGCDAPVPSTKPIAPGTATVFGVTASTGLPQGPITQTAAAGGAQGTEGGTVPSGTTTTPAG